jgi:hypothetical protein
MMPLTAGILEPLAESVVLGTYASWSASYLFGFDPFLWFAGHWTVWLLLDYIQLRGVQVRILRRPGVTIVRPSTRQASYIDAV